MRERERERERERASSCEGGKARRATVAVCCLPINVQARCDMAQRVECTRHKLLQALGSLTRSDVTGSVKPLTYLSCECSYNTDY